MKRIAWLLMLAPLFLAAESYRYQFLVQGDAASRVLIFVPFRVYYEAGAEVTLSAQMQPDGNVTFACQGLSGSGYVLRTLGFSGRSVVLLAADTDAKRSQEFAGEKLEKWRREVPKYSGRVKNGKFFKKFYQALLPSADALGFERTAGGVHREIRCQIGVRPLEEKTFRGIYFKVYPMLAETLKIYNHPFLPAGHKPGRPFPALWEGEPLDLTEGLNRLGALLEKVVADMVKVKQARTFRLAYRLAGETADEWLIEGKAAPHVKLWKSFKIVEMTRTVRLRRKDAALLADEIFINVRNEKGHGGYGKMMLFRSE